MYLPALIYYNVSNIIYNTSKVNVMKTRAVRKFRRIFSVASIICKMTTLPCVKMILLKTSQFNF